MLALGSTWRWRTEGLEHFADIRAGGHEPVMAFWHGRILPATYFFRHQGIVVITSENFDGEWIARVIRRLGYETARGSTSHGGRRALLQLRRRMVAGRPVGFTVDGPRGPARAAQPGAVWLSQATGNPVLPFHLEADRHWTLSSWDRTQIPKPFATVSLVVGEPFYVPPGGGDGGGGGGGGDGGDAGAAGDDVIRSAQRSLEARLTVLEQRALSLLS